MTIVTTALLALATLAQPDATTGGAAAKADTGRSVLQYISSGGVISYIMILLSIVALGLLITNFILLRREALAPVRIIESLDRMLKDRNPDMAVQYCKQPENDSFLSRVMAGGLSKVARSQFGYLELKPALEEAGQKQLERLDRINHGLAILAAVGPMLGLLGTVFGIIGAFAEIGGSGGQGRSNELAGYMSLALVNTAEGLIIAIPCTIAYSMFRRRTDQLVGYVAEVAEGLAANLQPAGAGAAALPRPMPGPAQRPVAPPPPVRQPSPLTTQ